MTETEGSAKATVRSAQYRRRRHLLVEWRGEDTVLVNADTNARARVDGRLLGLLSDMRTWTSVEELCRGGHPTSDAVMSKLVATDLVERRDRDAGRGGDPPDFWDTLELAVHRSGNSGGFREEELNGNPPSLWKVRPSGAVTLLPPPSDLAGGLSEVLSRRRSLRSFLESPLALAEISTLLHHSARVSHVRHHEKLGDLAFRPFPGGGARSELEIYVVARSVDGLQQGAHYFDARSHALVLVRERDDHLEHLFEWVDRAAGGLDGAPAVILLITAVFGRILWKYRGIGLSLIYKDTGCLFQTLYLVATAMGLAPCAIGGGEELANSRWLGLDPRVESQVGCFLIGPARR